jgi:hypothetical protein
VGDGNGSNVYYIDFYRRNWSVGIVYCADCDMEGAQMWVTGASIVECPHCNQLIDLTET